MSIDSEVSGFSAEQIMKPAEMQAMDLANNLYGAEAKTQAAHFLSKLGLTESQSDQGLRIIGDSIDASVGFEAKKEIADHFRGLCSVIGDVVVVDSIEVEVVKIETAGNDPDVDEVMSDVQTRISEKLGRTQDPEVKDIDERSSKLDSGSVEDDQPDEAEAGEEEVLIPTQQARDYLVKIFGEEAQDTIIELSQAQINELGIMISDRYCKLSIMRLNQHAKEVRSQQVRLKLQGRTNAEIAKLFGVTKEAIWQGLHKFPESLQKRIEPEELTLLLQSVQNKVDVHVPTDPVVTDIESGGVEVDSLETVDRDDKDSQADAERQGSNEDPTLADTIYDVGDLLNITLKPDYRTLTNLFDVSLRNVQKGELADNIRDDLKTWISLMQKDDRLLAYEQLNELELQIMSTLLGTDSTLPISAYSARSLHYRSLQKTQRKIEDVFRASLIKIKNARTRT